MKIAVLAVAVFALLNSGCTHDTRNDTAHSGEQVALASMHSDQHTGKQPTGNREIDVSKYSRATFAAGCFWCEEAVFESIKGVAEAVSGYAGGTTSNPTYKEVGSGKTGHAESVEVYYDSSVVDYPALLRVFFASQDPTQADGQGPDIGPQYRSLVFYRNAAEKRTAEQYIASLNKSGRYSKPIATQVVAYTRFWKAEDYHQNYVRNNPYDPYVQRESLPRLRRTQAQVRDLLKPERQ